jgi:IS605 OrfB family transposase
MCRLKYDTTTDTFLLNVRKEYKYCKSNKVCDKYVSISGLDFKYMKNELMAILASYDTVGNCDYPLSYRFHRVRNKWYLQVMFEQSFACFRTVNTYGTIGLDYNDGFIELSETDKSGNLIHQKHYDLKHHGTGKRAEAEIRDVIADIVRYAESRGKDVIIEDLDFKRTKARQTASNNRKGKRYNRMLHIFDYHRYKQTLRNTGFNHRVAVVMVNPRNTSKIGRQKYCKQKKLNVHQSASYVIARRGQGYIDRLVA